MMRSTLLVITAFLAASTGCNADATRSTTVASRKPQLHSGQIRVANGGSMRIDYSKRHPIFGQIAFGLAPAVHLDGAMAWLIRDTSSADPVLVVLSKESANDNLYVVAKRVIELDMVEKPVVAGRRVVKLFRDQHVVIEDGGQTKTAYMQMSLHAPTRHIGPELLRREKAARAIHVAGLGPVKIVFEPTLTIPGQFAP